MPLPAPAAPSATDKTLRLVRYLLFCSFLLALLDSVFIKPGVPCDEVAHFQNVRYYAAHWAMPVLGQPDVSYEGQMGPVYYTLAAVVYRLARLISPNAAIYATRWAGIALLPAVAWLSFLLAKRIAPARPLFQLAVTLFMAFNPSLTAIAGSVQNDMLAIVFALTATHLLLKWTQRGVPSPAYAAGAALLVSLAILTKATTVYIAFAIPIYLLLIYRQKAARFVAVFAVVVLLCAGWWFQRNRALYGDFSAQQGLTQNHYTNNEPPRNLLSVRQARFMVNYINSNYWLPREYYETNHWVPVAPRLLRLLPIVFVVPALLGWFLLRRSNRSDVDLGAASLLALQYFICLAIYLYVCETKTFFAPRTMFPTMIVYALFLCAGLLGLTARLGGKGARIGFGAVFAGLLAINFYYLRANALVPFKVPPQMACLPSAQQDF